MRYFTFISSSKRGLSVEFGGFNVSASKIIALDIKPSYTAFMAVSEAFKTTILRKEILSSLSSVIPCPDSARFACLVYSKLGGYYRHGMLIKRKNEYSEVSYQEFSDLSFAIIEEAKTALTNKLLNI